MSIFESLLNESDDNIRRQCLLDMAQLHVRNKITPILHNTTSQTISDGQDGIARIIYKNAHGRVILSIKGVDRVDEFGTTWNVMADDK